MVVQMRHRRHHAASEEAVAATRLVLGLSAGVGGMAGGIGLVAGQPMAWLAVPTAVLVGALARGATPVAGWAGAILWAGILPEAHAEAMLGPLAMAVGCVAIAIGPSRLLALLRRDVRGRTADRSRDGAWIEEA
jgi:hypothetical protein